MYKFLFITFLALLLFTGTDCKHEPPTKEEPQKPDTTSHNFTWTTYTFGGNAGSSYFKDVAIINDSDIWVVGQIYTSPDTTYNAAHWDGKKWVFSTSMDSGYLYSSVNTIFAINANDIWAGSTIPEHWDGMKWTFYGSSHGFLQSFYIYKIWGTSSRNLYFVGTGGTIIHYDGSTWTTQSSGTTIDLRDVWGTPDGKTVWACGYGDDLGKSILVENTGTGWRTIYIYDYFISPRTTSNDTIRGIISTMWSCWNDKYIVAATGIYEILVNSHGEGKFLWLEYPIGFLQSLRGYSGNDIFAVGQFGTVIHYNGSTWHLYQELYDATGRTKYLSVAVNSNQVIIVGYLPNGFIAPAVILMGKRAK
ncbi:MAG: hypothetical protein PHP42_10205 [Bacteroidota bacterium]|nr:hypothetical protein [Bacteroidota bacterium]